ncbi:unnamed protein product [Orchesella dallaii]|uniref:Uncharacterized protein n=1 Tax=Orchesella dallaii TaxID=48710 RepID=A0ABP1PJS9_9HEXA
MDNGSNPPHSHYDPHSSPPPPHFIFTRCLGFLNETKSRILQTFTKPVSTFPHTPQNSQGIQSLNYPFQPISSSTSPNDECLSGDNNCGMVTITATLMETRPLDRLEEKVTDLENAVKNILDEVDTNSKGITNKVPVEGVQFEDLGKVLPTPESLEIRDRLPPSIYQEIIALYEDSLNETGTGGGGRDAATSTNAESDLKEPSSKNKERNVRCEVLKWDKD